MREFVLLDSGPLGHACRRPGTPGADQCRLWIDALIARGVEVVVSEIADYEVRRELTRINASGSLRRLDDLVTLGGLSYQPISTGAWRHAAPFWADARPRGIPTASPDRLNPPQATRLQPVVRRVQTVKSWINVDSIERASLRSSCTAWRSFPSRGTSTRWLASWCAWHGPSKTPTPSGSCTATSNRPTSCWIGVTRNEPT